MMISKLQHPKTEVTNSPPGEGARGWVRLLLDSGLDFALYRFPREREPHLVLQKEGTAEVLSTEDGICEKTEYSGFIFAPFANTERVPALLIHPDVAVSGWELIEMESENLGKHRAVLSGIPLESKHGNISDSDSYKVAFRSFKNQLDKGEYQELVLSYGEFTDWKYSGQEDELFVQAMKEFPDSMVYLVYTKQGGRWFGCTPALLLEGYGVKWKTMVTHPFPSSVRGKVVSDEFGNENLHIHELLTEYIGGQLQGLNARIIRRGPYMATVEDSPYMRTDFTFHTQTAKLPMQILDLLHPTPAVCGLPNNEAWKFIRLFERTQRMYYGGYLGPLNLRAETNIYINIRCCNFRPNGKAIFFAGSELTQESRFEIEIEKVKERLSTLKDLG